MGNSSLQTAQLNKVFRAVHDRVCPQCGGSMFKPPYFRPDAKSIGGDSRVTCNSCSFYVTDEEMLDLAHLTVPEWGEALVDTFNNWRKERS